MKLKNYSKLYESTKIQWPLIEPFKCKIETFEFETKLFDNIYYPKEEKQCSVFDSFEASQILIQHPGSMINGAI